METGLVCDTGSIACCPLSLTVRSGKKWECLEDLGNGCVLGQLVRVGSEIPWECWAWKSLTGSSVFIVQT